MVSNLTSRRSRKGNDDNYGYFLLQKSLLFFSFLLFCQSFLTWLLQQEVFYGSIIRTKSEQNMSGTFYSTALDSTDALSYIHTHLCQEISVIIIIIIVMTSSFVKWLECSPMVWDTGVQSWSSHTKDSKKWYLMPPCLTLSIIRYESRAKWSNLKRASSSPIPWCWCYWKGSLRVALNYNQPTTTAYIYIYIYIYIGCDR